ncbi:MAG: hypothetical protein DHS20C02_13440 [Micavibrio sp.]|nr:MAG: hypothetical protein DHS20C02_13440 [Micavibrio sp.]
MAVTKRQIAKLVVLPGFWPRIRALLGSGFYHAAYFIAIIYQNVRLLPANHPYTYPENIGRYGLRHVIAEASNNLVFSKKNIDQIFVFFMILAGVVLLLVQFVLLFVGLLTGPALALGLVPFTDWFTNPTLYSRGPEQDLAFIILDRVFGMNGFFDSCVSTVTPCEDIRGNPLPPVTPYPNALHTALHQLLQYYSMGIVLVAVLVLLYYVVTIVGETIAEGTPFGKRTNKAWFPIRIIVFFALIIPLNITNSNVPIGGNGKPHVAGLNGAQIITLWTAKWGSNMASNSWGRFNDALTGSYLGQLEDLIATPNIPELGALNQFLFTSKMCQIAEGAANGLDIQGYIVREHTTGVDQMEFFGADFNAALDFAKNGTIIIRFGELDPGYAAGGRPTKYPEQKGYVFPWCGEITVQPTDIVEPGSIEIQLIYYQMIMDMWYEEYQKDFAECMLRRTFPIGQDLGCPDYPDLVLIADQMSFFEDAKDDIATAINTQVLNGDFTVPNELLEKGWAGAAIWYNRIAQMNGAVTTAIMNIPRASKYPYVMEKIYEQHRMESEAVSGAGIYDPLLANGQLADLNGHPYGQDIAAALYAGYTFWIEDDVGKTSQSKMTGSIVIDTINTIFGTSGLFDMRHNPTTHPLAQLSSLGKGMIEAAVRNALIATGGTVGSGLSDLFGPAVGQLSAVTGGMFFSFVQMTITMGVILYYVLPFLPFIYFIFAVSGWIKSIFEAIVAMPLWALAHIHIDGEGLPGRNASNGYYLLLEILLRPTLIVFGMLGSIIIFSSLVTVLNQLFDIVVSNVGGFDAREEVANPGKMEFYRAPVDEFFFTAMYVVIVYMIAQGVFKMIDQVPNNILRWIGVTVSTFQEGAGDPAGQLSSQVYRGGQLTVSQASGTLQGTLPHLVGG